MYWVMLQTHPRPDSDDYGQKDAAYASCFVATMDAAEAEERAREALAEHGWDSDELEDGRVVTREDYEDDPDTMEKFDQAMIDGVVITLHSWDVGAPDE